VIAFSGNRATLIETAPNVTAEDVIASTEAELVVPEHVPKMNL
jgi:acetate CoA/acetoacetate CoA-transferase beta subunit